MRLRRFAHTLTGSAASEAALTSAFRVLSGGAILTGLVLTFSSSHLVIGLVGALPLLARSAQLLVPRIVRRFGVWRVTRTAAWVERLGFLGAATVGVLRPDHSLALLLVGVAIGTLAAAVYDISLTAMTRERVPAEDQGVFFGIRTRWSSASASAKPWTPTARPGRCRSPWPTSARRRRRGSISSASSRRRRCDGSIVRDLGGPNGPGRYCLSPGRGG